MSPSCLRQQIQLTDQIAHDATHAIINYRIGRLRKIFLEISKAMAAKKNFRGAALCTTTVFKKLVKLRNRLMHTSTQIDIGAKEMLRTWF
jgi:hypothetical protein